MGRPPAEINKVNFEKLCQLQCTQREICDFFSVSEKTLIKWCRQTYGMTFSKVFQEKRSLGKIALRRSQFELASRSATMAIFLGKNLLGQTDNPITTEGMPEAIQGGDTHWKRVDEYFTSGAPAETSAEPVQEPCNPELDMELEADEDTSPEGEPDDA